MFSSLRGRFALILLVVGVSVWQFYTKGLKEGLDLQGGMHLVLEVQDPEGTMTADAKADAIDRAERIIRTRVDELGVEEPLIQKVGRDRLIVELAGIRDEARARNILDQAAFLEFKLVLPTSEVESSLARVDRAVVAALGEDGLKQLGEVPDTAKGIVPGEKSVEDLLFSGGDTTAASDSAAAPATDSAAAPLSQRPFTALLNTGDVQGTYLVSSPDDVAKIERFLALPEVQRALPRNVSLQFEAQPVGVGARTYKHLFVLEKDPFMTGDALENAIAGRDPQFNQSQVQFELSRTGGRRFSAFTGQHVNDFLAIVLDGEVMSAPVIRDRIGARGQIDLGASPLDEARDLALVLRAGALPARLEIVEERTVGPSLGQDSVDQAKLAGAVGIGIVVLIMIGYYKVSGFLSIIALAVYTILVLGGLAGLNATLTLPGLAGIILSMGMAVDANVLIFERIREELAAGRSNRAAMEEGFAKALSAIVDSNLSTLITALVLFQIGTGPVRGFAVTLSIGVVASFFSAIFVTRTFFVVYLSRMKPSDPISI
ncbi:MAG: protein translocase subunit SecD [Gemmatimonadetes bacterium]|nr:protein translocase subunit SecD [Gemmatimonadota bacterium]